ncbi:MAG: tryptophan synthase subunit alpha [Alphaproteobacteria bacterium]|nr:tryptophan synthase subunit alpha [Alphaproteobacteria bacterium]
MTRISKRFEDLKNQNKKALVTFITAGDPTIDQSKQVLKKLPASGADFIEIGMPFTDPMADGPAIQASSLRALNNGMNLKNVLDMVKDFRKDDSETPVILMGYFNPIYKYGCEEFAQDAKAAGADGLIVVDLPPEEDMELREPAQKVGLDLIRLVTPTTIGTRLDTVLEGASGFLYYVSITGVTGTKSADTQAVEKHIEAIKIKTDLPVAIGFGIKTPEDAKAMAQIADGVVVGSAIVENIYQNQASNNLSAIISTQVQTLKQAI